MEMDPPMLEESPPEILIALASVLDRPPLTETVAASTDSKLTVPELPPTTEPESTETEPVAVPRPDFKTRLPDSPTSLPPEMRETSPDLVPPVEPENRLIVPPSIVASPARNLISPELARLNPVCTVTFPVCPDSVLPVFVETAPEPPIEVWERISTRPDLLKPWPDAILTDPP